MKKTFTTLKNLKSLAVAASLLFASNAIQAQVIYTDVNPDFTISQTIDGGYSYDIDMNADGTVDFGVNINKVTAFPAEDGFADDFTIDVSTDDDASGAAVAVEDLTYGLAVAFSSSDAIGSTEVWDPSSGTLYSDGVYTADGEDPFPYHVGNFDNSTGKYVGVKFVVGANTYYGYIVINTTSDSYTLKGFAYESTPNTAIAAGAGEVTGVSSYLKANTTIYTVNNTIVANFKNAFTGKMDVVDMNGVVVKSVSVNGTSASVSMDAAQSGVYQVLLSGSEGFASDKVVILNK